MLKLDANLEVGSGWRIWSAYIAVPNADLAGVPNLPATSTVTKLIGGRDTKKISKNGLIHTFHTNDLGFDGLGIVNLCNSAGRDPGDEHFQRTDISVGIKAFLPSKKEAKGIHEGGATDPGRSETAYARAPVRVRCLAGPTKIEAAPKPVSVDIRVKKIGEQKCPREVQVTAYIDYEEKTLSRFRFRHNGKLSKRIKIEPRRVKLGTKTFYRVERVKTYHVGPGTHKFKVEVENGGKSKRHSIKVACPPFKVTWISLSYTLPKTHHCPMNVGEETTFTANGPGKIKYKIRSQLGLVAHEGTVKAKRKGKKYVATVKRKLSLNAVEMDMMAVWSKDEGVNSGWKKLKVECPKVLSRRFSVYRHGNAKMRTQCQGVVEHDRLIERQGALFAPVHRRAHVAPGGNRDPEERRHICGT